MKKLNKEEVMTKFLNDNDCKIIYNDYSFWQEQPIAVLKDSEVEIIPLCEVKQKNNSSYIMVYEEYSDLDFFELLDYLKIQIEDKKELLKSFETKYKNYIEE